MAVLRSRQLSFGALVSPSEQVVVYTTPPGYVAILRELLFHTEGTPTSAALTFSLWNAQETARTFLVHQVPEPLKPFMWAGDTVLNAGDTVRLDPTITTVSWVLSGAALPLP